MQTNQNKLTDFIKNETHFFSFKGFLAENKK